MIEQRSGLTWSSDQEVHSPELGAYPVLTVSNIQESLVLPPMTYVRGVPLAERTRRAASKGWTIVVGSNGNRQRIGNFLNGFS